MLSWGFSGVKGYELSQWGVVGFIHWLNR